jgi:Phosphodiester glycosidase
MRMPSIARRRSIASALGLSFVVASLLGSSSPFVQPAWAANATTWKYRVGHGIHLARVRFPDTPNEVRVTRVATSEGSRIDLSPAKTAFPMYGKTSATAANTPGAVLGVNGDFGNDGAPTHVTMIDGELWTSGIAKGHAFGVSDNGRNAFAGMPHLDMKLTKVSGARLLGVTGWNVHAPTQEHINGYTRRGGTVYPVPGVSGASGSDPNYCEARLVPEAGYDYAWSGSQETWITRRYIVDEQPEPCSGERLSLGTDPDAIVLSAPASSTNAQKILSLTHGDSVKMWWSFTGWPGVTDVVGGSQQLVDGGRNVAPRDHSGAPHILDFNPRTAIGVTLGCVDGDASTDCAIYLITVDGRTASSGWSLGMKLPPLAKRFIHHDVWEAVNLDGGGSTTLWAKRTSRAPCVSYPSTGGCLANRPSDSGGERSVSEALTVLSTNDPGTPTGLR